MEWLNGPDLSQSALDSSSAASDFLQELTSEEESLPTSSENSSAELQVFVQVSEDYNIGVFSGLDYQGMTGLMFTCVALGFLFAMLPMPLLMAWKALTNVFRKGVRS